MVQFQPFEFPSTHEQSSRQSPKLYFIYHALAEAGRNHSYTLTADQFQAHASLFVEARSAGLQYLCPEVTFDDGHISHLQLALPILEASNLTATFFITVGWTGCKSGYMSWSDLKLLESSGQQIGAHGWSHALLTECTSNQLNQELVASRFMLEDKLGVEIRTMALPGGRFNHRVIAACREAGYHRVYTSVPEPERPDPSFLVGRLNARSDMTVEEIREFLLTDGKALRPLRRRYHAKGITKWLLTNRLYDRLWWKLTKHEGEEGTGRESDEDSAHYQQ